MFWRENMGESSGISVCILAHNEELGITGVLESLQNQTIKPEEILLCANGCTDNTIKVAESFKKGLCKVIVLKKASKAAAWNVLWKKSSGRYIAFMDGDIIFPPFALDRLLLGMRTKDLAAIGGIGHAFLDGSDLLTRMIAIPPGPQQCLYGKLYLIDKKKLNGLMKKNSINAMPEELIHEDLWLSMVIGRSGWAIEEKTPAYYRPWHWKEFPWIAARIIAAESQIKQMHAGGRLPQYVSETRKERSQRYIQKIKRASAKEKIFMSSGYVLKQLMFIRGRMLVSQLGNQPLLGRERSEFSKRALDYKQVSRLWEKDQQ